MTVAEYALDTYLPNRPHNANSHEHVRSMIANHIVGTKLGSRRLGDVRTSEVRGWANERWEALSPSTAAKTLGLLRSVYAAALEDRPLKVSPVTRSVKLPRAPKPRISVLGVEEVARIQAAMVEVRAAAEMMVELAARLGFRGGTVRLAGGRCQLPAPRGHGHLPAHRELEDPGQAEDAQVGADLYLPEGVARDLARHLEVHGRGRDDSLFCTDAGLPYTAKQYGRLFARAVAAAGVEQRNEGPWTPHDLRHHYASTMLAHGLPPVAVAEWLGHDDGGALVMATYGHLMPSSEDRMRAVQATAWAV